MTVLSDQDTSELQHKIESLADTLIGVDGSHEATATPQWREHFRTDTDLQGIKALLAEKRKRLLYISLPAWRLDEATNALAKVETCLQKMEAKTTSTSYVCSIVKDAVAVVLDSTLAEIRRGELLSGSSAVCLQAAVGMIDKQDIFAAVMQRASLEALDSDVSIKKHVVAALAGLLQREMLRSVDSLSGY